MDTPIIFNFLQTDSIFMQGGTHLKASGIEVIAHLLDMSASEAVRWQHLVQSVGSFLMCLGPRIKPPQQN